MRGRKMMFILTAVSVLLLLCACGEGEMETMYIKADNVENDDLMQPYGQYVYQFSTDDSVNYMAVRAYELMDGEWQSLCELGRTSVEPGENKVVIAFDRIPEGFSVSGDSYKMGLTEDISELGCATTTLGDPKEIVPGEELPLAIQCLASSDTVSASTLEDFYDAEGLEALNYEHIYAVTICFEKI